MKDLIAFVIIGSIMIACMVSACETYEPSPSTIEYQQHIESLEELAMLGY